MEANKTVGENGRHFPGWNMLKEIDDHPAAEPILSQAMNDVEQLPVVTDKAIREMGAGIRITSTPKEGKMINRPGGGRNIPISSRRKLPHGDTVYEQVSSGIHQNLANTESPKTTPSPSELRKSHDEAIVNLDILQNTWTRPAKRRGAMYQAQEGQQRPPRN
ncbi:hypothetical protein QAD02_013166 [Eretmocerus hayati]|uniref:Uncharacterized protein n=1 Tax=Eretmocerus hayati TaxID=131215 RepID=A0ACC2P1E6_9HYME|nr:hypothetical protein QAD02_013166 [Eretmocerus hayati]